MILVGRPAIEADLGLKEEASCANNDLCFDVGNPSRAMVGTNAGTFFGGVHDTAGGRSDSCWVFLYEDSAGWHYVNAGCSRNGIAPVPGIGDRVFVTGCANFRVAPALAAKVLGCLGNGTSVDVDSAPVYADGHIWWHLAGRGWMAHEFLVAPKNWTG